MTVVELLRELDTIDAKADALNERLQEGPRLIEAATQNIKRLHSRIAELKGLEARLAKEAHALEIDAAKHESEAEKLIGYQRQAKSNEEYQLFRERAERERELVSKLEEEALLKMEEQDRHRAERGALLDELKEAEEDLRQKQAQVEATAGELGGQIAQLHQQRAGFVAGVERDDLEIYERVRRSKRGRALAPVTGSVCGACFVSLPPQLINLSLVGKSIVQCVSCGRILYVEDADEVLRASRGR